MYICDQIRHNIFVATPKLSLSRNKSHSLYLLGTKSHMTNLKKIESCVGQFFGNQVLETCRDEDVTRPRVRPISSQFDPSTRVEFPRLLRERFPIGTKYIATVKVCQKTKLGKPYGPPYLKAYDIAIVPDSIPDQGLLATVRAGSVSGLAYEYFWKTKSD